MLIDLLIVTLNSLLPFGVTSGAQATKNKLSRDNTLFGSSQQNN